MIKRKWHVHLFLFVVALIICNHASFSQNKSVTDSFNLAMKRRYQEKDFTGMLIAIDHFRQDYKNEFGLLYTALAYLYSGDIESACPDYDKFKIKNPQSEYGAILALRCHPDRQYRRYINQKVVDSTRTLQPDFKPVYNHADSLRGALRKERTCYDVTYYDLDVRIMPDKKAISGNNTIYFKVVENTRVVQVDLYSNLNIQSVEWNSISLKYRREYNAIFVDFPEILQPGTRQKLTVKWSGTPLEAVEPPWMGGFVWGDSSWTSVASEYRGASLWWPCKDHPSDEPDSMSISIEVPTGLQCVSNGNPKSQIPLKDGFTRFNWFVNSPINAYDVTFYAGNYSHFSDTLTEENNRLPLDFYARPQNAGIAKQYFGQVKDILEFYCKAFGPFPFPADGFGLAESPYQGMENQGMIAFGSNYTKTNDTINNRYRNRKYDWVIVHETAHEWWGNSVTASDMADLWIQEGFATYAEMMFLESKFGYNEYLSDIIHQMRQVTGFWPLTGNRDVNDNTFVTGDVYTKGALMLHNFRCILNDDPLFFKIIHDMAIAFRWKIVNTKDIVDYVCKAAGKDRTPFFNKYLYDKELPVLYYKLVHMGNAIAFSYQWKGVEPDFTMPFCIKIDDSRFVRLTGTTTEQKQTFDDARSLNFYNQFQDVNDLAPANSMTFYATRMVKN